MGCRSDYLEQNSREKELQRAAALYEYVLQKTRKPVPSEVTTAAQTLYCTADYVADLCAALKAMPAAKRDTLVYNGKDPVARDLANWWDTHQAADKQRMSEERAEKRKQTLRATALAKLTLAEKRALGLA